MNILEKMVNTQNNLNIVTKGETWSSQNLDWRLAITQESAELTDSFDWKWWKHMIVDTENAKIEIVDIWHFVLSMMIEEDTPLDEMLQVKFETLTKSGESKTNSDTIKHIKNITKVAANNKPALDIADAVLMVAGKIGMSFEDIAKLYFGKAVLNNFRQLHGYSEGSYTKIWNDVEDNVVMQQISDTLSYDDTFEENLLNLLTETYIMVS